MIHLDLKSKNLKIIGLLIPIIVIRLSNFPQKIFSNVYDSNKAFELIYRSIFSDTPMYPNLNMFIYRMIPESIFAVFIILIDFLTSYILKNTKYFIFSTFLPSDLVSIENLLLALIFTNHRLNILSRLLLPFMNIYYLPLLSDPRFFLPFAFFLFPFYNILKSQYLESYRISHIPNFNSVWFFHLNMFKQYSFYLYNIFFFTFLYIFSFITDPTAQLFLINFFKPSNTKNFLFFYFIRGGSRVKEILFSLVISAQYIEYLFRRHGSGNPNFVNWINFAFIVSIIFEMHLENLKAENAKIK
ncbi:hypothetical protein TCON_0955 [Astathelohania contejeani]|uniref:Microsporidial 8TM transmembrane domain-containing protein n=1 Tax=Astathelohania contejeani TaxID=164912 RepID=A0ABQ7I0B5_9MICR|nr:hypothetical protein TCON_0955 [Thelohania contejeani]